MREQNCRNHRNKKCMAIISFYNFISNINLSNSDNDFNLRSKTIFDSVRPEQTP